MLLAADGAQRIGCLYLLSPPMDQVLRGLTHSRADGPVMILTNEIASHLQLQA